MSLPIPDRYLQISDALLDDLLSALRRHHARDCRRLIEAWAIEEAGVDFDEEEDDWLDYPHRLDHPLSTWAHREIGLHVEAGRFEHALCLVENHRRPFSSKDMHARLHLPEVIR